MKGKKVVWIIIASLFVVACGLLTLIVVLGITNPTPPASKVYNPDVAEPIYADTSAPTRAPTTASVGTSRNNPIPVGVMGDIGGGMVAQVADSVIRPADEIIHEGNMFNEDPETGQEYILIGLSVGCNKSTDSTCNFGTYSVKIVDSQGNIHDAQWATGVEQILESSEFFGHAVISGAMAFIVPKGDNGLVLFYDPLLASRTYFALPLNKEN